MMGKVVLSYVAVRRKTALGENGRPGANGDLGSSGYTASGGGIRLGRWKRVIDDGIADNKVIGGSASGGW